MEWKTINDTDTLWELTEDNVQLAVAFKYAGISTYGFIAHCKINEHLHYPTEQEAKEAALVAIVTERIES